MDNPKKDLIRAIEAMIEEYRTFTHIGNIFVCKLCSFYKRTRLPDEYMCSKCINVAFDKYEDGCGCIKRSKIDTNSMVPIGRRSICTKNVLTEYHALYWENALIYIKQVPAQYLIPPTPKAQARLRAIAKEVYGKYYTGG